MTSPTEKELNEWYKGLEGEGSDPERKLPSDNSDIPWDFEWAVDEGLDPDDRGAYFIVCKFGNKYFKIDGAYDSWQGTDWYGYEEWYEVEKRQRTEDYWGAL